MFIVDDDDAVRDGLSRLLADQNLVIRAFASAEAFLAAVGPDQAGCVVLDLNLPGMSGTAAQEALAARGVTLPIVFLTGYGDVPTSVQALKNGAVDFLQKPVSAEPLLTAVHAALARDADRRAAEQGAALARARLEKLTPREREVMALAVSGQTSKEIARGLGISHRTVELHRARIMQKTGAASLIELAGLARAGGRTPTVPDGDAR